MGELEEPILSAPVECPVCHSREVRQIAESGLTHQCQTCSHKFLAAGEPCAQRDLDFPSPEDHELD
jgi:hypothetical protein